VPNDIIWILAQGHAAELAGVVETNALSGIKFKTHPVVSIDFELRWNNVQ
jgi:hypothetical protein